MHLSLSTFCIGSAPVFTAGGLSTDPGQMFIDDLVYSNINTAAALNATHVTETPSTGTRNKNDGKTRFVVDQPVRVGRGS